MRSFVYQKVYNMATPVTSKLPSLACLIQACKSGLTWLPCFCLIVGFTLPVSALTLHRSFRTREAGVGFGAGSATVAYPVDAKVAKVLDEAAEKEAEKVKVIVGKCTNVSCGMVKFNMWKV